MEQISWLLSLIVDDWRSHRVSYALSFTDDGRGMPRPYECGEVFVVAGACPALTGCAVSNLALSNADSGSAGNQEHHALAAAAYFVDIQVYTNDGIGAKLRGRVGQFIEAGLPRIRKRLLMRAAAPTHDVAYTAHDVAKDIDRHDALTPNHAHDLSHFTTGKVGRCSQHIS